MIQNYRRNGPITKDQTGAEVYATIFTLSESPLEKGNLDRIG
jgi:hypothetical protein